jgi:hypothetical protein
VSDIHLNAAIADQMRQGSWPAYLRVEASVVKKPEWVETRQATTGGGLKVIPALEAGRKPPEQPADEPAKEKSDEAAEAAERRPKRPAEPGA